MLFFAPCKPHWKWFCYFAVLSHGKLDLSFFFTVGPKVCGFAAHIDGLNHQKIICHKFWRNRFVYLQTHLLM